MAKRRIITLLTDYGIDDPYVAEVKGVILSIARNVQIVDITHNVPSFDERRAAFLLLISAKYFPKDTIHICVVDPKVGTERRGIFILTKRGHIFIGPDTGIMWPAVNEAGIVRIYEIDESKLPPRRYETFHGRDVFAYVAAKLAIGVKPSKLGRVISNMVKLDILKPSLDRNCLHAEIMHIDKFGNIITNVSEEDMKMLGPPIGNYEVTIGGRSFNLPFCKTYAEVPVGKMLMLFGGTGFLEISVNMGSAAKLMDARIGDRVHIRRVGE